MKLDPVRRIRGAVRLPGDKSISHRYAILGGLARGTTVVSNYSPSQDCRSTLDCLAKLGVAHRWERGALLIEGRDGELTPPAVSLDAGNSGTTMRLLSGVLAGQPFRTVIGGDDSLSRRPMKRIMTPLGLMGARIQAVEGEYPPLTIDGAPLTGIRYRLPVASAQVKSCLLLAGLRADGVTTVVEPTPTRDHTERALPVFGAEVRRRGDEISLRGGGRLNAAEVAAPGDFSAAAFFLLAAAVCPDSDLRLENLGVNPTRSGLLEILERSGAALDRLNPRTISGEPVCDLRARFAPAVLDRFPGEIKGRWIPNLIDEIPALAVLGVRLRNGISVRQAGELRKKESDRIQAVVDNLRALGVQAEEFEDGFRVPPGQKLRGGKVQTHGDHRIAMAFAVASLIAEGPIQLDDPGCAAVSFPGFFEQFTDLCGG